MKKAIYLECMEYWEKLNPGKCYPHFLFKDLGGVATVRLYRYTNAFGDQFAVSVETFDGDGQTDYFKSFESAYRLFEGY